MNIIITGAGGFLGNQLARELQQLGKLHLQPGEPARISRLTLVDQCFSDAARQGFDSQTIVEGDIADPTFLASLISSEKPFALFHLAAMVSGDGERDFDGCMRVNLDATRSILELCRAAGSRPRLVFASSLAAFGGAIMPPVVSDSTKLLPQTTYGMTKVMGELLINDYSRKGYLDGRAARLPTVFIRPGKPNAAASSFASGLFREPLAGQPCDLPVSRSQGVPLLGYRRVIHNFIQLMQCDPALLGDDRTVTMPSTQFEVGKMIEVLEQIARERGLTLGPIHDRPDPVIERIVAGWPIGTEAARGESLGMRADDSVRQVIEEYLDDFGTSAK